MTIAVATAAVASDASVISQSSSRDHTAERLSSSDPDQVRQWLRQHSHRKQLVVLDKFLQELRLARTRKRGTCADSTTTTDHRRRMAQTTVNLLRNMIGSTTWKTAAELLCLLRGIGRELHAVTAEGGEPAIGNLVRRVMAAVREEALREAQEASGDEDDAQNKKSSSADDGRLSLQSMLWALPQHVRSSSRHVHSGSVGSMNAHNQRQESLASEAESAPQQEYPSSYFATRPNLKQAVLEAIQEIMTDLEFLHRNINEQVTNHIHAGEIILTCGQSKTIELFLKEAYKKMNNRQHSSFTVIVCGNGGYEMARGLAQEGIETTFIEEAAVFAVMARVHKVLLPAHAVLANGGLVASSGCNLVALAASHLSVPVVCVTGLYKLCPMYPHEGQDTLQDLVSPIGGSGGGILQDYAELSDPLLVDVELVNPLRDYIEPKYVSLYITNVGCFQPSFIYRLLAENYHTDDWKSF